MKNAHRDLTDGSIILNIWHLALPMMAGNVMQNLFNLVDMKFVGRLGPSALAAVSISGIAMGLLFVLILGIYMGTTAMVARFIGARQQEQAEKVAMQSLILGGICYGIIAFIGYPLSGYILRLLGAEPEVVAQGVEYIRIMFLGSFAMILGVVLSSVLRAAGDAITPLIVLVISTVANIILDPLFIFGIWRFPRFGVAGSALATVLARCIGAFILLWVFLRGRPRVRLRMSDPKVDFAMMRRIVRLGIFASVQGIMRSVSGLFLMPIIAGYGTAVVAAFGVSMRLQMLIMMPSFGLAGAVATLVGQNLGAEKPDRAEKTAWITAAVGSGIMTFMGLICVIFSRNVIGFFSDSAAVMDAGSIYLKINAGFFGFIGLSIIIGRAFNGAGDTISPMVTTAIGFIGLRISLALLLSSIIGLHGVWLGIAASTVIQGMMNALWFKTGRWKTKQV